MAMNRANETTNTGVQCTIVKTGIDFGRINRASMTINHAPAAIPPDANGNMNEQSLSIV
jgi:hypothetical protein